MMRGQDGFKTALSNSLRNHRLDSKMLNKEGKVIEEMITDGLRANGKTTDMGTECSRHGRKFELRVLEKQTKRDALLRLEFCIKILKMRLSFHDCNCSKYYY